MSAIGNAVLEDVDELLKTLEEHIKFEEETGRIDPESINTVHTKKIYSRKNYLFIFFLSQR